MSATLITTHASTSIGRKSELFDSLRRGNNGQSSEYTNNGRGGGRRRRTMTRSVTAGPAFTAWRSAAPVDYNTIGHNTRRAASVPLSLQPLSLSPSTPEPEPSTSSPSYASSSSSAPMAKTLLSDKDCVEDGSDQSQTSTTSSSQSADASSQETAVSTPSTSQVSPHSASRKLSREDTLVSFDDLDIDETMDHLHNKVGIKAHDFALSPPTRSASKPKPYPSQIPEWFDPLAALLEHDAQLLLPHRTGPMHGKTLRRLLDLGFLTDSDQCRWSAMDWTALQHYDERCNLNHSSSSPSHTPPSTPPSHRPGQRGGNGQYPYSFPSHLEYPPSHPLHLKGHIRAPTHEERARKVVDALGVEPRELRRVTHGRKAKEWIGVLEMGKKIAGETGLSVCIQVEGRGDGVGGRGRGPVMEVGGSQEREREQEQKGALQPSQGSQTEAEAACSQRRASSSSSDAKRSNKRCAERDEDESKQPPRKRRSLAPESTPAPTPSTSSTTAAYTRTTRSSAAKRRAEEDPQPSSSSGSGSPKRRRVTPPPTTTPLTTPAPAPAALSVTPGSPSPPTPIIPTPVSTPTSTLASDDAQAKASTEDLLPSLSHQNKGLHDTAKPASSGKGGRGLQRGLQRTKTFAGLN